MGGRSVETQCRKEYVAVNLDVDRFSPIYPLAQWPDLSNREAEV